MTHVILSSRRGAGPFAETVFLSAALVFLVQPMFARMATPLLGGSPNVWNVSLVCFQAALLAGFAYAHLLSRLVKGVRKQVIVHGALLALSALVLPFDLTGMLGEPDPARPVIWLIGVFALSIAPPFATISATAPLIQAWYARTGQPDAHDPYHLYAASNAGSLIGLAAYPLLLEPLAPLAVQAGAWSVGYAALAVMLVGCGLIAARGNADAPAAPAGEDLTPAAARWRQRLWWVTLAFVPSSLLVGVTTHIATDVASAPFLWAPPLMLYITSFIVVFARKPPVTTLQAMMILPLFAGLALFTLSKVSGVPTLLSFFVHLGALFAASVACHGLLAADRPATGRLTEFYLLMSLGGVLGGAFNALLAPVMFDTVAEYGLMLTLLFLLLPQRPWLAPLAVQVTALVAAGLALISMSVDEIPGLTANSRTSFFVLSVLALVAVYVARGSRVFGTLAAAALWMIGIQSQPTTGGYSERGFFGVIHVRERADYLTMIHGTTLHGAQHMGDEALYPGTYYAPGTPMGQVFAAAEEGSEIGVIGLGVGSVACYAKPGQAYTFYEIDPIVARLASDPAWFSFLSECTPDARVVLGDGRLLLAGEPDAKFDLLLVDAFSSDSVPSHLMTREALSLYMSKLKPGGIVLLHVSNRYLALETVVARTAAELGVPGRRQYHFVPTEGIEALREQSSIVVALAHDAPALVWLTEEMGWTELQSDGGRGWSDDYSNIPGAIWDRIVHNLN
jgi:spermidine synthase